MHRTRSFVYLLHYTPFTICQLDQHKSTGANAAHKMIVKLAKGQFQQRVYIELLHSQIPKAQKVSWLDCLFLHFWNLLVQKLLNKMMVKLTPVLFHGKWKINRSNPRLILSRCGKSRNKFREAFLLRIPWTEGVKKAAILPTWHLRKTYFKVFWKATIANQRS